MIPTLNVRLNNDQRRWWRKVKISLHCFDNYVHGNEIEIRKHSMMTIDLIIEVSISKRKGFFASVPLLCTTFLNTTVFEEKANVINRFYRREFEWIMRDVIKETNSIETHWTSQIRFESVNLFERMKTESDDQTNDWKNKFLNKMNIAVIWECLNE